MLEPGLGEIRSCLLDETYASKRLIHDMDSKRTSWERNVFLLLHESLRRRYMRPRHDVYEDFYWSIWAITWVTLLTFRMHLEASLRREVDDTAERDSLIEQANRVQQSREDAQKAAQNRARAKLMSDVTKNRKDQIETHALTRSNHLFPPYITRSDLKDISIT